MTNKLKSQNHPNSDLHKHEETTEQSATGILSNALCNIKRFLHGLQYSQANDSKKPDAKTQETEALAARCDQLFKQYREKIWLKHAAEPGDTRELDDEIDAILDNYQRCKAEWERKKQS